MDDKLQKFVQLVEAGTYTKAAEQLHISQPALSIAIQKLETEFGAPLVIRIGKRLDLTPAGKAVYRAAQEHQQIAQELKDTLYKLRSKRPRITIGMVDSIAELLYSTAAFEELESQVDITLLINNSRYLRTSVEQHKISCAILIDDELEHQGTTGTPLGHEQLVLVCHPDAQAALQTTLAGGVIEDFISYDKPSTTYRHIQHFFAAQGMSTKTRLYSTSPSVMLGMVLAGKGCAVLPEHMCRELISSGSLVVLLEPLSRPVSALTDAHAVLPEPVSQFLMSARSILSQSNC